MFKSYFPLTAAVLLFGTAAQANELKAQITDLELARVSQKETPGPKESIGATVGDGTKEASAAKVIGMAGQELHPCARPIYLNGGHFGGNNE